MDEIIVYSDMLEQTFSKYTGQYKDLLMNIPLFFNLLQKIYNSDSLTWDAKFMINACFSYFAVPEDLIPDEGPEGYLDDLFICAYVINELIPEYSGVLYTNWNQEEQLDVVVVDVLKQIDDLLGVDKIMSILRFTGLFRLEDICEDITSFDIPKDIKGKIERLKDENIVALNILKTIFTSGHIGIKSMNIRRLSDIKKLYSEEEWNDVISILEKLESYESTYDTRSEDEFEKIRQRVILQIDESIFDG